MITNQTSLMISTIDEEKNKKSELEQEVLTTLSRV
jgi:hypothetical protein